MAEARARILRHLGAQVRVFDPSGLPLPDSVPEDHPKAAELRDLALWSKGIVWCGPEYHDAMIGIEKAQIDWNRWNDDNAVIVNRGGWPVPFSPDRLRTSGSTGPRGRSEDACSDDPVAPLEFG